MEELDMIAPDAIVQMIEFHPASVALYNQLSPLAQLQLPTVWSAYKAGMLGDIFPIAPFSIHIVLKGFQPMTVQIDPPSNH